jgi:hypothetical protein
VSLTNPAAAEHWRNQASRELSPDEFLDLTLRAFDAGNRSGIAKDEQRLNRR